MNPNRGEAAGQLDRLPGIGPGAQQLLDRHRRRVARLGENGRDIRAEAKDALSHYSDIIAAGRVQVINSLTIVAAVFLPLSFLTGYFGMKFRILTTSPARSKPPPPAPWSPATSATAP